MRLPSFNDYTNVNRGDKYAAAKLKRETEDAILWFIKSMPRYDRRIDMEITWFEETKRRDPDNVYSAVKFILDAMTRAGKIHDDSQRYVRDITNRIRNDTKTYCIVYIKEVEDE